MTKPRHHGRLHPHAERLAVLLLMAMTIWAWLISTKNQGQALQAQEQTHKATNK